MSHLALQQEALLEALFAWPPPDASKNIANYIDGAGTRGLKAYQSNGHMLAQRSLATAYPVLAQMLGDESFAALAGDFWHTRPPVHGDLAQWGADLGDHVSASPQLADEPYLGDVARTEWAMHRCAGSADQGVHPDTFALLTSADPARLRLILAPGCAIVRSAWPVVSLVSAHLPALGSRPSDLAEAGEKLRSSVAETAVVWRYHFQPRIRLPLEGEAEFLEALLAGRSLGDALPDDSALDFTAWLPMAVQSALLVGVSLNL